VWATKPSRLFNLSSSLFHVCLALLLSSCSYCLRTFPKQPLVSRTPSHLPTCPSICAHVGDVWQRCVIVGIATRYRPTFNLQGALLSTRLESACILAACSEVKHARPLAHTATSLRFSSTNAPSARLPSPLRCVQGPVKCPEPRTLGDCRSPHLSSNLVSRCGTHQPYQSPSHPHRFPAAWFFFTCADLASTRAVPSRPTLSVLIPSI
jgi:hypothetical protein